MTDPAHPTRRPAAWLRYALSAVIACGCLAIIAILVDAFFLSGRSKSDAPRFPRQLMSGGKLTVWWDDLPAGIRARTIRSGEGSNVRPADYVGPDACKRCHHGNYESWSHHPHHWMNTLASEATIKGDFSGKASIAYRGGRATFRRDSGKYLMHLERGSLRRTYQITQTIGSRFFQYYAGKQLEGPEPPGHRFYKRDHVLPFGYWLDAREWVPVVHIGSEVEDDQRPDPFAPPDHGIYYADYAVGCNSCHTTFPLGDQFARRTLQMGAQAPLPLHWSLRGYLEEARPGVAEELAADLDRAIPKSEDWSGGGARNHLGGLDMLASWEASRYAVTLGVSCEACHLGCKEHVDSEGKMLPKFFPASPHLFVENKGASLDFGRTHNNVNWACGRCHTGPRPQFAAGMSTWNSVEYADAMRGSCYSQLRCVDCHNPHRATGPRWSLSADRDDGLCLKCHDTMRPAAARQKHTHHPAGSAGARCMNCHMPRINEGLQDVVRTHMIYSPTRADMIESGQPNACNLCHTDRPIDWTLRYLKEWYGKSYDAGHIETAYPERKAPVALGWLKSDNPAVRLVAADALTRDFTPGADASRLAKTAATRLALLTALDDPLLINRQFAGRGLERMLGIHLADFGYHFYQSAEERRRPLAGLRARFLLPPAIQRSAPHDPRKD
jgi:predicted CXXCH cytochrome family protein